MKKIILLVTTLILCYSLINTGCTNNNKNEIEQAVKKIFYNNSPYYDSTLTTNEFSIALFQLVDSSKKITEMDAERIEKSEYPGDKPICIEGEIFTSVYEGHSGYKIQEIKKENNCMRVTLNFADTLYKLNWCDTLIFVNENGWKLDNVLYCSTNASSNLKENLTEMINSFKP